MSAGRTAAEPLLVFFVLFALVACRAKAVVTDKTSEFPLWPGNAPGSAGLALTEVVSERSKDPALHDRAITGISKPSLTAYSPQRPNGAALIVAPGGSYLREAWDKEGVDTARWFVKRGVTVFLLKYRLPAEGHQARSDVPLQDAQRAVRLVRERASAFRVDARRIGVMGFSAGGHLASLLASRFDEKVYEPLDAVDRVSARPDFLILLYPVVSMEGPIAHAGSRRALLGESPSEALLLAKSADRQVSRANPPTLLLLAADDQAVSPENSLRYFRALRDAGVSAELHVYESGGHGFGMRSPKGAPAEGWPELSLSWLKRQHL
jgi:acetyl esterase/lipase